MWYSKEYLDEEHIQPINKNKDASGDTQKSDEKPPVATVDVPKIDTPQNTGTPKAHENKRKRKPLSCFEIWTIILASVGILVAAGTGLAIYWQARISSWTLDEIKKGGTDTHDLALAAKTQSDKMSNMADAADKIRQAAQDMVVQDQKMADNAKASLDASNKQSKAALDAAVNASKLDQRAWIGVSSFKLDEFSPQTMRMEINGFNTGRTPALHVQRGGYFVTFRTPITSPPPGLIKVELSASGTFAPQAGGTLVVNTVMTQASFDDVVTLRKFMYVYGEFHYDDIFRESHVTTFCIHFVDARTRNLAFCDTGNDMN